MAIIAYSPACGYHTLGGNLMALVLAGKLLAMRRENSKLTLTIRPTTTTQQDGKTLVVMMEDEGTDKFPRCGQVVATVADPLRVEIGGNEADPFHQLIQGTVIGETVRLAMNVCDAVIEVSANTPATPPETGKVIIPEVRRDRVGGIRRYTLVSFQRGGL
jgi:hypothetical protein